MMMGRRRPADDARDSGESGAEVGPVHVEGWATPRHGAYGREDW